MLGAVAVHSPPGGTRFSQYPLASPLEVKRLKRDNKGEGRGGGQEAAKKVTDHPCLQELREVLVRTQPLPTTVDPKAVPHPQAPFPSAGWQT